MRGKVIDLTIPKVMGIVNLTPDSFYDGGLLQTEKEILHAVEKHLNDGAAIIDVGAYSTRPGAVEISEEEEYNRLLPFLKIIVKSFPHCIISVDTFRSTIARYALEEGVCIINDISGLADNHMPEVIKNYNCPYILMHMRGTPQTMTQLNRYHNLMQEIIDELLEKVTFLKETGIRDIIIDPGFGFAKNIDQNFDLLRNLQLLKIFEIPILVGISRKSMVYKKLGIDVSEALNGTTVLNTLAIQNGASLLRVHDVKEAVQAIALTSHFI